MSLGIIRGEIEDVIERLKESDFDDEEYPVSRYDTSYDVSLNDQDIHLLPGTQTDPLNEFVLKHGNEEFTFDAEPPGILPYMSGSFQIKGVDPAPIDVGLPAITNERGGKIAVRWLFTTPKSASDGLSKWGRLQLGDEEEIEEADETKYIEQVRDIAKPDKATVIDQRQGKSPSPVITYPEPIEVVESRKEEYWWEAWCARRQEIMSSWRVLIPNTSKTLLPTILSPTNTIVADNFNIAVMPDGETTVALAAVLGTQKSQDFLRDISPWASGDTPRPRIKHVCATIHQNQDIIEQVLEDKQSELSDIAGNLEQVHEKLNEVLRGYVGETDDGIERFRARYTGVSNENRVNDKIDDVKEITANGGVVLDTSHGEIEVEFHDEEYAGAFAIGAWLAVGFGDTVETLLDVPSAKIAVDPVRQILCKESVGKLREDVVNEYY
jgi:hypothetical protein